MVTVETRSKAFWGDSNKLFLIKIFYYTLSFFLARQKSNFLKVFLILSFKLFLILSFRFSIFLNASENVIESVEKNLRIFEFELCKFLLWAKIFFDDQLEVRKLVRFWQRYKN